MARKLTGQRILAGVLLLIVAGIGCNPLMLQMYLFRDMRQGKIQSHFNFYDKAHAAKKKKEIKIVVLSERGRTLSAEFVGDERMLTNGIVNQLRQNFLQNKEKVIIVPPGDVEKFKREHDDWNHGLAGGGLRYGRERRDRSLCGRPVARRAPAGTCRHARDRWIELGRTGEPDAGDGRRRLDAAPWATRTHPARRGSASNSRTPRSRP